MMCRDATEETMSVCVYMHRTLAECSLIKGVLTMHRNEIDVPRFMNAIMRLLYSVQPLC